MAEMIPESIAAMKEATSGEKRVFKVLRDALIPDEDYIVWFEPKAVKKRPDFLIWAQDWGLLVIEVKDWSLDHIVSTNHTKWTILRNNIEEVRDSPVEQARKCFIKFKELIQSSPTLRHSDGPNQGNIRFPIGYCAAFTQITRKQAEHSGLAKVLAPTTCLFSDDLPGDFDTKETRLALISLLKKAFVVRFPFDPLQPDELKVLRCLIFPEVRIRNLRAEAAPTLRTAEQAEIMQALDLEQERTAKSILEGHRVLKGVAGSGKTLVLSCRARYLKKFQPHWRILIVCFNISLRQYIRQLLDADHTGIDVFHYHGLVKHLTDASLKKLPSETEDQWNERVGVILHQHIASGNLQTRYDAILIDEGQDFAVSWLQSLTELLNPETDSLLLCLDPAQNIFGRKVSFKSAGIQVQGKRPISLKKSYRNTTEILTLARRFSGVEDTDTGNEANIEDTLFPVDIDRHGPSPSILQGMSVAAQVQFILHEIQTYIQRETCNWRDVGVLYSTQHYNNFAHLFSSAFRAKFGEDRLYWVTESRHSKADLDLTTPTVKLSTIESAKGMEFRIVFLVGLEILPRPDREEESERKLTYVGLTRAQDMLYLLADTTSGYIAELTKLAEAETSPAISR